MVTSYFLASLVVFTSIGQSYAQAGGKAEVQTPQLTTLKNAKQLLSNDYQGLEAGYGVDADGMWNIAASTYMRGVTGDMIDWWFSWSRDTARYKVWHPRDHVSLAWDPPKNDDPNGKGYIGGSHLAKEMIGGELQSLRINFRDPADYFGPTWKADFAAKNYSTAICFRVSFYDSEKNVSLAVGHGIHLVHKEVDGVRMRSRFWLGDLEVPLPKELIQEAVPRHLVTGLSKHCTEEMAILAGVLPKIWRENSMEGKAGKTTGFDKTDLNSPTYGGPGSVKRRRVAKVF